LIFDAGRSWAVAATGVNDTNRAASMAGRNTEAGWNIVGLTAECEKRRRNGSRAVQESERRLEGESTLDGAAENWNSFMVKRRS
jgi:hypothetical protein